MATGASRVVAEVAASPDRTDHTVPAAVVGMLATRLKPIVPAAIAMAKATSEFVLPSWSAAPTATEPDN